ncbi:VOC family protein [Lentibacillus sediminis]|uniref:VOC family protein n=1 Tax=Lentibacillus sediminis TaxID=1940529 RepID=UPI000C1BDA3A|nr:VOC family protein [Lentibacillus sediminis]
MEEKFFQPPATYVNELSLKVTNLERSVVFYQNIIGFRVLEQTDRKAILTADGKTPLLTLEQPEGIQAKEERKTGLFHFAILLPTRADLANFLRHVVQKGVRLGASDHHVSEALYLNDEDGNGIEVYHDRSSEQWKWSGDQVFMNTEPLDADDLIKEVNAEWSGLPSDTVIGHIHLHVASLPETETFYRTLNFQVATNYPGALFMSTASYHHHLGLNIWNGEGAPAPAKNSAGLNWYSLKFPSVAEREEVIARLEQAGNQVSKDGVDYFVEDPAGNLIRLQ